MNKDFCNALWQPTSPVKFLKKKKGYCYFPLPLYKGT